MKQAEDKKTKELPGLGRRGRPPVGERAMTPAERQKAYRERLAEERYDNNARDLSRVTIMKQLVDCFDQLDRRPPDTDLSEGAKYRAEELLAELATRYELDCYKINRRVKAERVKPLSARVTK